MSDICLKMPFYKTVFIYDKLCISKKYILSINFQLNNII